MNKKILLTGVFCLCAGLLPAQTQKDLRLNELMVTNETSVQDDFGCHTGWIEVFNKGYGTVDCGGCFFTLERNGETIKYRVPLGDVRTKIKPLQTIVFFADGKAERGTFHTSFQLAPGDKLSIKMSDGITVLDCITVPELETDRSYGRMTDGGARDDANDHGPNATGHDWNVQESASPGTNNGDVDGETKNDKMRRLDPYGWILSLTAMSVVFISLILLFLAFKRIGKASIASMQRKSAQAGHPADKNVEDISGEVYAAICAAMHLCLTEDDAHDTENTILTIEKVRRHYSPWSSKIHTLRQLPQKK